MSFFKQACIEFETYLHNNKPIISSFHPYFEKAFWEMVLNGGKRFRPNLLLSVVCAKAKEQVRNAFDVCLSVECLHTYSLIHDDLPAMDNAALRRNHQTLHCKYDEASAILVGDALNTYSFYLLANSHFAPSTIVELISCLSENGGIGGMVLGQALDCHFENTTLALDKLQFIHTHKTAKLIATSLKMGAIIANLSLDMQKFLYNFGLTLGLYFQIRDDIIDSIQDESISGKTANNDANKNSYVNLMGLDGAKGALKEYAELLQKDLEQLQTTGYNKLYEYLNELLELYLKPLK
ncbi:polyprenyl synthetase family protein [Helicobacter trogontum]|nr:polyprenyl synthetase family protein [Helicobacter trogontum]MCI5787195.1 polyprenyl synthetase family protein [Helicobacter trogontum]MDY5186321.1 polyprenyl synthetase family protein [Helicobacter trogontum]